MAFKMKYPIVADYLPKGTKRRPGKKLKKIVFIVAHDTGNKGSTAKDHIHYYRNSPHISAAAQLFCDDVDIRECIPALLKTPERANHVIYNVTANNKLYDATANEMAIGVELCWGKEINSKKAYNRYVWTLAYLCYKYSLDPRRDIIGHDSLDPRRKSDPTNALAYMGKTFNQLITDVLAEFKDCTASKMLPAPQVPSSKNGKTHKVIKGDTLWDLSQQYGTTVDRLKALNPEISVTSLVVGSILLIERAKGRATTSQKPHYHNVVRGDTFWGLSSKYKVSVENLRRWNPMINEKALTVDSKVLVGYTDVVTPKPANMSKQKVTSELQAFLDESPVRPYPGKTLKRGAKGKDIEAIQRAVKVSVDGVYGMATENAVKAYQKRFTFLTPTGEVDYRTWNVMF
ncbi:LysM peptidoglycan-binding domain-containing protein [Bacillus chungangensis]|uniref:Autolysin n=1 Tax=Bacillus chungangensis TaxID=587633 RepID=A0ABT9WZ34_9BACI|nr:LysM peptidoglycan-binding domain-containing protein [Bacillus chungangensis]MDQ0178475.1 LysM repeat protein/N-acetyl-anhydromuramyl-L-alanine amidase AmpD [Bacillus chungangensis]